MNFRSRSLSSVIALLFFTVTSFLVHNTIATAATKPTPKASTTKKTVIKKPAQKKPAQKKPAQKKPAQKKPAQKKPRRISKPLPSPSPKWPPKGFQEVDGVYISTPKSEKELVGVLSAKSTLLSEIRACEKNVCAVVYVASETKCKWWEVQAIVIGKYADVLGDLRTLAKGTKAKERKTIILISQEPVEDYAEILNMKAFCRNDPVVGKIPSNTFTPNPALPQPTPTPTPTPSAS